MQRRQFLVVLTILLGGMNQASTVISDIAPSGNLIGKDNQTDLANDHVVSARGSEITLNGQAIKILGLRCSNALISDTTTRQLIDSLDSFQSYGLNSVSIFFMGSRFGDVKGYRVDSSLDGTDYRGR